jgi:hypothetical protein
MTTASGQTESKNETKGPSILGSVQDLVDSGWCVRFENVREWNGTVPFLGAVLVFGSGIEWNGLVPRKEIFFRDAECTRPPKSAGRGGMEIRLIKFSDTSPTYL